MSHSQGLPPGGPFFCFKRPRCKLSTLAAVLLAIAGGWLAATAQAQAQPRALQGQHQIRLHSPDGQKLLIGQVLFAPTAEGRVRFELKMDHSRFTDHFLSMREMKCLPGGTEILCHLPYPYAQPGTVTPTDLAWLEHSLLFMFKKPADFGAKLWNGVYFELRPTERGLEGKPQAVDLNLIAAPAARLDLPPFRKALRDDMADGARWFGRLSIEPE